MTDLIYRFFPYLKKERDTILANVKKEANESAVKAQTELNSLNKKLIILEKRIAQEEGRLKQQMKENERQKNQLTGERTQLTQEKESLERRRQELLKKFEKLAGMTREEARENVLNFWEQKLSAEVAKKIKDAEEQAKRESEEKSREILLEVMRYGATDYVVEYTLSTVALPNEEFKGRIIGKEGRNVRAFELATGVEVDLDEEDVVKISSFDPVKREVARVSLERLIKDGRIQPSRIEEVVSKTRSEIKKTIYKEGEKLCHELSVYNLPKELIELLGKFKYRFSYGQNMIQHTLEETRLGVALANELNADVNVVRLACLLHDIGKVITDKEGSHVQLGVDLLKKYRFPEPVISAVETHHEDKPFTSAEGIIVYLADAISGSRPGARREDVTEYIKRIQTMEKFIKEKEAVKDVAVLQAGREIRVIVNPKDLTDDQTVVFAEKLKQELQKYYSNIPGQIKLTAIREFRTSTKTNK